MTEYLMYVVLAALAGAVATVCVVRRYRSRDGRVAQLVKILIGEPKE